MKTYLITGAAGFIGSHYLKYILKKYITKESIKIIAIDNLTYAGNLENIKEVLKDSRIKFEKVDIVNKKEISRIFFENDIDYVVNFAAESHVDKSIEEPEIFIKTNILGVQNLLDIAQKKWEISKDLNNFPIYKKGVKFLQISTDEVYGSLAKDFKNSININYKNKIIKSYGNILFTEEDSLKPRSPYSASKASADLILLSYWNTYKFPMNITRSSNNYGEYQYPEKLIPITINKILNGEKIPVYGKGDNVRDWIYVEEHCEAIEMVLNCGKIGEIYNVGTFTEKTNIEVVKLIIEIINKEYEILNKDKSKITNNLISYVQDRLGHDIRYALDSSKLISLGWEPKGEFEEKLKKTVKWYIEKKLNKNKNKDKCNK